MQCECVVCAAVEKPRRARAEWALADTAAGLGLCCRCLGLAILAWKVEQKIDALPDEAELTLDDLKRLAKEL